jgi:hypothetical protein
VPAGHVLEPPDPRLEFALVLVGFRGCFLVMHTKCPMKCVREIEKPVDLIFVVVILLVTFP